MKTIVTNSLWRFNEAKNLADRLLFWHQNKSLDQLVQKLIHWLKLSIGSEFTVHMRRRSVKCEIMHIFSPPLDSHVAPVSSLINTMKYSIAVTGAPTAVTDTVVLVYGLSIMSRSAPVYFGPRKGEMPGLPFYWVCLPQPWVAQVWQIGVSSRYCKWCVRTSSPSLYSLSLLVRSSFFASLVFRMFVELSEALEQFRHSDYVTVLPRSRRVPVCRCSCLISVGGFRLLRRSEFVDFIDSGVHRFCFTSPCWIIDWIANAYD